MLQKLQLDLQRNLGLIFILSESVIRIFENFEHISLESGRLF